MTRAATFRARGGRGAQLAERLLRGASLMADVPGCELWLGGARMLYQLRSGRRQGWAHRHMVAEGVYVVVSGSGRIKVDDERFELRPRYAVRVAPASTRDLEAGPDGLEVLASGSHSPGDGEMVADWWTT